MSEPKNSLLPKLIGILKELSEIIIGVIAAAAVLSVPANWIIISIVGAGIITIVLIFKKQLSVGKAGLAWLIAIISVALASAIIPSLKTTVTGKVIMNGDLAPKLALTLADSSGLNHNSTTDSAGAFSIHEVPRGSYKIMVDGKQLFGGELSSFWIDQLFQRKVDVGTLVYNPPPTQTATPTQTPTVTNIPTVTSTLTFTPTPFICPYQGQTDNQTIVNLIQSEATAVNTKNLDIIMAIFDSSAVFIDYAPTPPNQWNGPQNRYEFDLFRTTEFQNVEHFDILPAGQGIVGNTAYYTSGSRGQYRGIDAAAFGTFNNGSTLTTEYGSDHWILRKNDKGCWVIFRLEFNAGFIKFP